MNGREFGTIIQIGDILVSEDVVKAFFACDYPVCKGACCIVGDSGAPVSEGESENLERDYPRFSPLMTGEGRQAVSSKGFFEIDIEGDMVTPLVEKGGSCAFCHFAEDGSCLCAVEMAGLAKPESCRLYPVRVTNLTGGGKALNLHEWEICRPAFEKGRKEGIRAYRFLEGPLTEVFGTDFYEALCAAASHVLGEDT